MTQYYMFYIHVAIMIYVGFGFLMTFLRCAAVIASRHVYFLTKLALDALTWALAFPLPCLMLCSVMSGGLMSKPCKGICRVAQHAKSVRSE